jgi:hypothetical protein
MTSHFINNSSAESRDSPAVTARENEARRRKEKKERIEFWTGLFKFTHAASYIKSAFTPKPSVNDSQNDDLDGSRDSQDIVPLLSDNLLGIVDPLYQRRVKYLGIGGGGFNMSDVGTSAKLRLTALYTIK